MRNKNDKHCNVLSSITDNRTGKLSNLSLRTTSYRLMSKLDKITIGIAIWVLGVAFGYAWAWKALEGTLK